MENDSDMIIILTVLIVSAHIQTDWVFYRIQPGYLVYPFRNEPCRWFCRIPLLAQGAALSLSLPDPFRDRAQCHAAVSPTLSPFKARNKEKALGRSYAHPCPLSACHLTLCYLPLRCKLDMAHCLYLHRNRENSGSLYRIGYGNAGRNTPNTNRRKRLYRIYSWS